MSVNNPKEKWENDTNRHLSKKEIYMYYTYIKRCSLSLEMEI